MKELEDKKKAEKEFKKKRFEEFKQFNEKEVDKYVINIKILI
jgi:hypothetical protein